VLPFELKNRKENNIRFKMQEEEGRKFEILKQKEVNYSISLVINIL
jgi:hypothetical protein